MSELQADDRPLTSALRAVAAADRTRRASAAVEARLLAEVMSIARVRRVRRRALIGVAAALLLFAIALPSWKPASRQALTSEPDRVVGGLDGYERELTTEFFPLTYSSVPASGERVVRMQVPRTALARFGVTSFVVADDRSSTVVAEVIVGDDGLARAVRFVHVAGLDEQEQKQ
jgi:hypothetical protein